MSTATKLAIPSPKPAVRAVSGVQIFFQTDGSVTTYSPNLAALNGALFELRTTGAQPMTVQREAQAAIPAGKRAPMSEEHKRRLRASWLKRKAEAKATAAVSGTPAAPGATTDPAPAKSHRGKPKTMTAGTATA